MADYTQIDDDEMIPDAPIPSMLGFRWRDNPIAIAEGAPGAPKVSGLALDVFRGGAQMPAIWGVTDLDGATWIRVDGYGNSTGVNWFYSLAFSSDGGANWGAWQEVWERTPSIHGSSDMSFAEMINLRTGARGSGRSAFSVPVNCNAVRFTLGGDGALSGHVFVTLLGGVA